MIGFRPCLISSQLETQSRWTCPNRRLPLWAATLAVKRGVKVSSTQERLEAAIGQHLREVRRWSEEISFKDLARPKSTSEVFVPLDIYLLPQRQHVSRQERLKSAALSSIQRAKMSPTWSFSVSLARASRRRPAIPRCSTLPTCSKGLWGSASAIFPGYLPQQQKFDPTHSTLISVLTNQGYLTQTFLPCSRSRLLSPRLPTSSRRTPSRATCRSSINSPTDTLSAWRTTTTAAATCTASRISTPLISTPWCRTGSGLSPAERPRATLRHCR